MFGPGTQRSERVALYVLVALYLASACGFALATPYGEAPDEFAHLAYIEHIVRFHRLPDITEHAYSLESFQPPFYYMIGAAMVVSGRAIIGSSKMGEIIAPVPDSNPAFRDQRIKRNFQALRHLPADRWSFWPYALRAYSILLGLGVVLLTYATARVLIPPPTLAAAPLIATAFAALIPQANFIRASISNENLADLIGAWVIWLLALHLTRPPSSRRIMWLGIALGLGLLTKLSLAFLMLPVVWVLWLRRRDGGTRVFLRELGTIAIVVIVVAGWFYAYRWATYSDPLALAAWRNMLPGNSKWQLTDFFWLRDPFRAYLWSSFWGVYGWQVIWMQGWIYQALAVLTVMAVPGGVYLALRRALTPAQLAGCVVMLATFLLMYGLVIQASTYLKAWQGREMFPALSSVCVLLGLGLGGLALGSAAVRPLPVDIRRQHLAVAIVVIVVAGLLALNVYSIFGLVLPLLNA